MRVTERERERENIGIKNDSSRYDMSLPSLLIFHDLFNTILDLYKRGIGSRQFSRLIFLESFAIRTRIGM